MDQLTIDSFTKSKKYCKSILPDSEAVAFDVYLKYAYRPFSSDKDSNTIDPRTFLWIRDFLKIKIQENATVVLPSTWFQSLSEMKEQKFYQRMPNSVNNIDGNVVVNSLFGIFSLLMNDPIKYGAKFNDDLKNLFIASSQTDRRKLIK